MKRHLWISLILSLILLAGPAIAGAATSGLVAYYPFSGNANDASGNGYNLTVSGATLTTDRNGTANSAYLFNGSSSGMSASAGSAFSLTSLTLSAWIKVSGAGTTTPESPQWDPQAAPFRITL